jgi:hypothetical protein
MAGINPFESNVSVAISKVIILSFAFAAKKTK